VSWHLVWLWVWFFIGSFVYWIKRAYFLITGPNPIANNLEQFMERAWMPLLFRFAADSGIFWATFSPIVLSAMLHYLGWERFANSVDVVTQYGFFALFFGMGVDSAVDIGVTKIPLIKDFWPQMPGPLPQKAVVEAQIVEQTVTQLQTTTTVVPKDAKP
jgi:hypothetical protein